MRRRRRCFFFFFERGQFASFFLRHEHPLFAFLPPREERKSPAYVLLGSKKEKCKTHRHLAEELDGLFAPLLHRPGAEGRRLLHRSANAAAAAAATGLHCSERPRRRWRRLLGVPRGSRTRRESAGRRCNRRREREREETRRTLFDRRDFCSENCIFFPKRELSTPSLFRIKLARFLRPPPPPRLFRARPRAAMASSAPSPASAVDFLTLLTKLKVEFVVVVFFTGDSKDDR